LYGKHAEETQREISEEAIENIFKEYVVVDSHRSENNARACRSGGVESDVKEVSQACALPLSHRCS